MKLLTKAWGGIKMLMDTDVGEGGVKNQPKSADVVYGRPPCYSSLFVSPIAFFVWHVSIWKDPEAKKWGKKDTHMIQTIA